MFLSSEPLMPKICLIFNPEILLINVCTPQEEKEKKASFGMSFTALNLEGYVSYKRNGLRDL